MWNMEWNLLYLLIACKSNGNGITMNYKLYNKYFNKKNWPLIPLMSSVQVQPVKRCGAKNFFPRQNIMRSTHQSTGKEKFVSQLIKSIKPILLWCLFHVDHVNGFRCAGERVDLD
jgi:hypothetical protein